MDLPWIEIKTIVVYLLFLVGVGVVFSSQNKNSEEYFKAGSKGTWWLVGINMFKAGISAYTFVGNAVGIYQAGWSPVVIYAAISGWDNRFLLASDGRHPCFQKISLLLDSMGSVTQINRTQCA